MAPISVPDASLPPDSLFHLETITQYVPLPPLALNTPHSAICATILSPLLLTYFAPARGIILAYQNVKLSSTAPSSHAQPAAETTGTPLLLKVINEYSSPFLWATSDFLVWRPRKGVWVEGRVTHQSSTHLTLSYLNAFPITILKQNMPTDWSFHDPGRSTFSMTGGAATREDGAGNTVEGYWVDGNNMPVDEVLKVLITDWEIKTEGGGKDGAKVISTLRIEAELEQTNPRQQRREETTQGEAVGTGVQSQGKSKDKSKGKEKKDTVKRKSALKKSKHEARAEGEAMEVD